MPPDSGVVGQVAGHPVATLLGGVLEAVPVYASCAELTGPAERAESVLALREQTGVRIAGGEMLDSTAEVPRHLRADALDLCQLNVVLAPGMSRARTLGELALLQHRALTPHSWTSGIGAVLDRTPWPTTPSRPGVPHDELNRAGRRVAPGELPVHRRRVHRRRRHRGLVRRGAGRNLRRDRAHRCGAPARITREPLGVLGAVVPWNYALLIATWTPAPAPAAGDSVV